MSKRGRGGAQESDPATLPDGAGIPELRVALREVDTPEAFLRTAFGSASIDKVTVSKLEPGEFVGPYLHEYGAPEEEPEQNLLANYGPGRYKFHALASRSQEFKGGILAWRIWPVPSDHVEPAVPRKPRERDDVTLSSELRRRTNDALDAVSAAKTIQTLTQQPAAQTGTTEALGTLEKVAGILAKTGKGDDTSGVLYLKMLEFMATQHQAQLAMMQKQIELLALRDDGAGAGAAADGGLKSQVETLRELATLFGVSLGGGKADKFAWLPAVVDGVGKHIAGPIESLIELRREELALKRGEPLPPAPARPRLPSEPTPTAVSPGATEGAMPKNDAQWTEVLDTLFAELTKPADDRDTPGLAAWLETIVLAAGPDGPITLYDRVLPMIDAPERLVRISIKALDPRFASEEAWPGVLALFDYIRKQEADDEDEPAREATP